ncbi:hypothetical protein CUN61_12700 [Pseudomonas arsenicoxydans]|uniref:Uncharacterized protein n=1 Tax=Pseudomonas arsenicoxydans TaxID=702115 RepID=A0A4P6G0J9_9PSED|nr:hypothetical protein CUN61_12700 [Pseudomonas arsenicoxydans]
MGMPPRTLRVRFWDAERPLLHSHAERGNDQSRGCDLLIYRYGCGSILSSIRFTASSPSITTC